MIGFLIGAYIFELSERDEVITEFDEVYVLKLVRKSISKREDSKNNYDLISEFSFCN